MKTQKELIDELIQYAIVKDDLAVTIRLTSLINDHGMKLDELIKLVENQGDKNEKELQ